MLNIHLSATPVVNASRVLKQTSALESSGIFDSIEVVGHAELGQLSFEVLSPRRRVVRIASLAKDKRELSLIGKALWFATWMVKVFWTYRRSGAACINAHSISVLPLAWALSVRTKSQLVYDPHELETKTSTMTGVQGWLCTWLERIFIGRCDAVFVVSDGIADWYADAYQIERPIVVRNLPEIAEDASDPVDLKSLLGIDPKTLLFVHVGALTGNRNIPDILDAFAHPDNQHHVVFLGDGPMAREVKQMSEGSSRIHMLAPVPATDVVRWIRSADFGLCLTEVTCESNRYALPNKVFECVTAGLPLVATYLEEVHRIFGDGYTQMIVEDVASHLLHHISRLDNSAATKLASVVAQWEVPKWPGDATRMIDRYSLMEFS